ncbi:MAG: M28 family peptidase [Bacteroidales bacterium]|nr:M28 family peptidase [Bacteroidales bacterium]
MLRKSLILSLVLLSVLSLSAQNLDRVRQHIQTLSSPEFHGRGYTFGGSDKAAKYIADEFKSLGVKPFGKSYFQNFSYDVNTFPAKMKVSIDGKEMQPGTDFVVGQMMPTTKASYELFLPDSLLLNDTVAFLARYFAEDWSKKMLVIDYAQTENKEIKMFYIKVLYGNTRFGGIMELIPEELVMSVGKIQQPYPVIKLKRGSFDRSAKSISIDITAKLKKNFAAKNVIGYVEGKNPDKYFVFCGHYDHLGTLGKDAYFPGAQDNASGTAIVLDLAAYYAKHQPKYTMVFMLFFGEEAGLLGSSYYVEHPLFPLNQIVMGVNLDMVGTGDEGITVVNLAEEKYADIFWLLNGINTEHGDNKYFETIKQRKAAANSDHYSFNRKDVRFIFIYTMGPGTYYHNVKDKYETLSFTGYGSLFGLLTKFVEDYE